MLRSLIAFCLSRRLLVLVAFAAFLGLGVAGFVTLNIEAYPDPAPPIIEIIAQQQGQSPEEVERYITIPIEVAVASTPGLKFIRSNTGLGTTGTAGRIRPTGHAAIYMDFSHYYQTGRR